MSRFALLLVVARFAALCWLGCAGWLMAAPFEPGDFLQAHCLGCHGEKLQSGDRRFDRLATDFADPHEALAWEEVLDALNLGVMPPADRLQPSDAQRLAMVDWITQRLKAAQAAQREQHAVRLRRLNAHEYRNTLRDLLRINMDSFDPTSEFPPR